VARGAVNSRAIYQFIDNIQFTSAALASTQAVPEPSAIALLGIALALAASRRRRRSRLSRGTRDVNAAQSKIDVRWMIIARRAR
jgi:hypothetical protein